MQERGRGGMGAGPFPPGDEKNGGKKKKKQPRKESDEGVSTRRKEITLVSGGVGGGDDLPTHKKSNQNHRLEEMARGKKPKGLMERN